jgi:hypothetical protein
MAKKTSRRGRNQRRGRGRGRTQRRGRGRSQRGGFQPIDERGPINALPSE